MNKQAIQNYTNKLNILVSQQGVRRFKDSNASSERFRIQTSGRKSAINGARSDLDEANLSSQSSRLVDQKERSVSVKQKHRMIIESPNSRSTSSQENNFFVKSHLKDGYINLMASKSSMTFDVSKQSQSMLNNNTISTINAANTKYDKPIQRIFQQIQASQLSSSQLNPNSMSKTSFTQDDFQQRNQFSMTTDRSSAREEALLKNQQLIQNKYTYILQNSLLFKKQAEIKQTLPINLQNMYDINLIDVEDVNQQQQSISQIDITKPVKIPIDNIVEESNVNSMNTIQKSEGTLINFTINSIDNKTINRIPSTTSMKSTFNRQNIKIQEEQNTIQNQQITKLISPKSFHDIQENNSQNTPQQTCQSEQGKQSNEPNQKNTNQLLLHQRSLRGVNDRLSPTKSENDKRRFTEYTKPQIFISDDSNQSMTKLSQTGINKTQNQLQDQKINNQLCQNCSLILQNQQAKQNNSSQLLNQSQVQANANARQSITKQELEFCLLDVIEKLDKGVIQEIEEKQFQKKYFTKIVDIINTNMPSVMIRVNELLGTNSSLHCFLQYINNFFNYIFTLATKYIDNSIKKKVEEDCHNYIDEIAQLKKSVYNKITELIKADHKNVESQKEISNLKNLLNDEKNRLQYQVNNLEERIEEMTNFDKAQEKYDEMSSKIQEMQMFIKSLQTENRVTKQNLEDKLCSLGHSIMIRSKESIEYSDSIKAIKDQTLISTLNDHPFLSAFLYNRTLQSQSIDITDQYMIQRLKVFIKNLKEGDLSDKNVAEAFMEYILSVSNSQYEGFQEVEQIIRYLQSIEEKPISIFFQKLFGILGHQLPSQQALKEVLQLNKVLILMNYHDLEDLVAYDIELDLLISASTSNQNVVIDFRNQFSNSSRQQKCHLLSHLLQSITVQEDIEKHDEIYNSLTVSSTESIQTFESKLNYQKVKSLASELKLKPFTLLNYIIQTYEKYSKERKKDQSAPKTGFTLNSNFIPKVLCDCYKNIKKFQLMYYIDMQNVIKQQQVQTIRSPSTQIYIDSILEEEVELQNMRKIDKQQQLQLIKKKKAERKKQLIKGVNKVKNTLFLINGVSPIKNRPSSNSLKVSEPSLSHLDSSLNSSKRSLYNHPSPKAAGKDGVKK